jgi:ATP-dependent Clp protease protease subunit
MQFVKPDIVTVCVGQAASAAAILLASGATGKRMSLPNARVMLHQVMGGVEGQATEIEISARHILFIKERLNRILAKHTGQPIKKIEKDTDRDYYMGATEAKEYGIVDTIVESKKRT